jgi:hypothetical protein
LGKGSISLKGPKKRPWLEIARSEIDRRYLSHQLRLLKEHHDGAFEFYRDRIATDGFYDKERFRFQGDNLWRVYELIYPKDKKRLSREVLNIAGLKGAAALWIDQGRVIGKQGSIRGRYSEHDYGELESWFNDLGIPTKILRNQISIIHLSFKKDSLNELRQLIRPLVHINMRKTLQQRISNFR